MNNENNLGEIKKGLNQNGQDEKLHKEEAEAEKEMKNSEGNESRVPSIDESLQEEGKQAISEAGVQGEGTTENGKPEQKKKRKIGKLWIMIIIIFLILVAYRVGTNIFGEEEEAVSVPINVKTTTAETGTIYVESPISGTIQPIEEVAVIPLASGEITSAKYKEGDYVKKGAVLFTIDSSQVQSNIDKAREAYEAAKTAYERMELLYNEEIISQQDFESTQTQYKTAEMTYNSAKSLLSNYTVTAPISGYLTSYNAVVGGVAGQSQMATIANTSTLVINANVSESLAVKINKGDVVDVYVASLDKTIQGKITTFSGVPAIGTVTYPITVSITNGDKDLMAGMFAEIKLKSDYESNATIIPSDAVMIKGGEPQVVTLNGNMPVINAVQTGIDNGEYVEILSGINPGDVIVISGQQYVKEGQEVNIAN